MGNIADDAATLLTVSRSFAYFKMPRTALIESDRHRCLLCNTPLSVKGGGNYLFKNKSRCPMILNCGHTICFWCLKGARRGHKEIRCTVCQKQITDKSSLKDIPVNYHLLGSLIAANNQDTRPKSNFQIDVVPIKQEMLSASVSRDSDVCVECNRLDVAFDCFDCENCFCHKCFKKVHSSAVALRSHQARPVLSVRYHPLQNCEEHDKVKDFYCTDDEEVVCANCALVGSHKGHNVVTVNEKNRSSVMDIESALETADVVGRCLKASDKKLGKLLDAIQREHQTNVSIIRDKFQLLHSLLQLREQNLIQELNERTEKHCISMKDLFLHIDMDYKRLQTLIIDGEEHLRNSSRLVKPEWLNDLRCINSLPCYLPLSENDIPSEIKYVPKVSLSESLCQLVTDYGDVTYEKQDDRLNLIPFEAIPKSVLNEIIDKDDSSTMPELENVYNSMESLSSIETSITAPMSIDDCCSHISQRSVNNESHTTKGTSQPLRSLVAKPRNWTTFKQELVRVSHIVSPHEFYIHRSSDGSVIKNLEKAINTCCRNKKLDPSISLTVNEEMVYLVYQSAKKSWCRARVIGLDFPSADDECAQINCIDADGQTACSDVDGIFNVEICYIDYGNKEIVQTTKLRYAPPEVVALPDMALKCCLWQIEPINKSDGWSQEAINSFSTFVHNKLVEMTMYQGADNDGTLYVDLGEAERGDASSATPMSIRDALVFLEYGYIPCAVNIPDISKNVVSSAKFTSYFEPTLPAVKTTLAVYVSHIKNPSSFFIQPVDNCIFLSEVMHDMQNMYLENSKCLPPLCGPYVGMPCAAQYSVDDQWYRAEIVSLKSGRKLEVFFVDFGNREVVSYTEVKRLHHTFMKFPKMAVECKLADIQLYLNGDSIDGADDQRNSEALKFFYDLVYMKNLNLKVEGILNDNKMLVSLYCKEDNKGVCVNALLVEKDYAFSTGPCSYQASGDRSLDDEKCSFKSMNEGDEQFQHDAMANIQRNEDGVVGFDTTVHISHIVSPESIFVQLTCRLTKLKAFMKDLQQAYNSTETSNTVWNSSTICSAYNEMDKCWYRAKLLNHLKGDDYEVLLIDYGETLVLKKCNIRPLLEKFSREPMFAFECCLVDIAAPGGSNRWPSIAIEYLQEFALNHDTLYLKKMGKAKDDVTPVKLLYEEVTVADALAPTVTSYNSLAVLLIDKGLALPANWKSTSPKHIMPRSNESTLISENATKSEVLPRTTSENYLNESREWCKKWKGPEVSFYVGQKFQAQATYVNYSCDIYMHDLNKALSTLNMIKCALSNKFKDTTSEAHDLYWYVGQSCVAQFAMDSQWYRGEVKEMDIENGKIKVLFIDYGNEEYVSTDSVRKDIILTDIPQQGFCCNLHNIKPVSDNGKWNEKAMDLVWEIVMNNSCQVTIKTLPENGQKMTVSLTVGDVWLEQVLVELNYATFVSNEREEIDSSVNDEESVHYAVDEETFTDLQMPPFGEVFGVEITEVKSPNVFFIQRRPCDEPQSDYQKEINANCTVLIRYSEMMNTLACSWPLVTKFKAGTPCCAQYVDGCWFRACILDYNEESDEVRVFYVDFGNEEFVSKSRVRQLPSHFLKLPKQAVKCTLHQVVPVTDWEAVEKELRSIYEVLDKSLFVRVKNTEITLEVDLLRTTAGSSPGPATQLAYQYLIDSGLIKLLRHKTQEELL